MRPVAAVQSRTEQVYDMIRDSICTGELASGTHLVQEELASTLGVSRQPIQQAMLLLKNDGLVVELGARGLYVAPLDAGAVIHHYQIRVALDQLAAQLICQRITHAPDFSEELRRRAEPILAEGEAARSNGSAPLAVSHDVKFHSFLYEMSGNPFIASTAEPHWNYLRRVMIAVLLHAERGRIVWQQHRDILAVLLSGDADASAAAVKDHVLGAQTALLHAMDARDL